MDIPMIDDFGDIALNRLATRYRNELNDARPPFGNLYLLVFNGRELFEGEKIQWP